MPGGSMFGVTRVVRSVSMAFAAILEWHKTNQPGHRPNVRVP